MRDFSGHHFRKTEGPRERFGLYSDPTAREAMRNAKTKAEEGLAAREAFGDLMRACAGGHTGTIEEAAMRLYRVLEGAS